MMLLAALALAASSSHAEPPLARIGDCGWVHGRYRLANGSSVHRIWIVGTNHIVNLDVDDGTTPLPLKSVFDRANYEPSRDSLYADFYLCARTPRIRGRMQRVHLEMLKNVRIRHLHAP
jgi:hypothetical protein